MPGVREWDGASYDKVSAPQQEMGRKVLERLSLRGDELVLDAGCGSGRVTEMLLERLPNGRVIALDVSQSMAAVARDRIGDRVDVRVADLLDFRLDERVDAIFSTATFHWIADHDALFSSLRGAVRDGGQLVAQCGGAGNVTRVQRFAWQVAAERPFATFLDGWTGPWNYRDPAETEASLRAAGFSEARCWLEPAPAQPALPREFLSTVMLTPFLEQLPQELHGRFVDAVAERLGDPLIVDYVRLNIDARA